MRVVIRAIVAGAMLTASFTVGAVPITFGFSGTADAVNSVQGHITFDPDAAVTWAMDSDESLPYELRDRAYDGSVLAASATTSSGTVQSLGVNSNSAFSSERWPPSENMHWSFTAMTETTDGGYLSLRLAMRCIASECAPLDLANLLSYENPMDVLSLGYAWSASISANSQTYRMNSFTRVPEPSTLALFGIGALGLAMARRRAALRG